MTAGIQAEGKFITLEGIDGAGLTTHSERLQRWLNRVGGKQAYLTKEPTNGPIGAQIRLKLAGRLEIDEATLALLFAADRMDHLHVDIIPKLANGVHVICDRYYLSSLAYQSLTLDLDWVMAINAKARRPDLTVLLDVPVSISIDRIARERHVVEFFETEAVLERVRQNFLRIIDRLRVKGENIVVIQGADARGSRPIREIEREIQRAVQSVISRPALDGA
ncbi:MAG: dTMP kinase [Chloroflexota bacterium]